MKALNDQLNPKVNPETAWALWNLNGTITADLLDRQFDQLMEQKFDGVVLRASSDICPAYMSDEFLHLFSHIIEKIQKAGKKFVIGDDFSRPAPTLFASSMAQSAAYRAMRLTVDGYQDLEEGESFSCTPRVHYPFYFVAVPLVHHIITLEGAVTIAEGTHLSEQEISWTAPEGDWRVIRFEITYEQNRDGSYMANMFSMKGAQSYSTHVLDPLYGLLTPAQKKAFTGILCELPAIIPSAAGIPWDEELLVSKYRSRFKRNLIETVPALFFPVDDREAKYRPHIFNFLQDTLYERFPQVLQKWATLNKVEAWVLGPDSDRKDPDSSLSPLLAISSNEFTMSGTSSRDVSSLAEVAFATVAGNNQGIKGHINIGVAGRDISMASFTIAELKEQLDRLVVHGAQKIIIDGFRANCRYRHEETTPPGLSFHHPDFQVLGNVIEATRTTLLATKGRMVPKSGLALIYPSQSALADYRPEKPDAITTCTGRFMTLIESLQASQQPYTILNETDLADCTMTADGLLEDPKRACTYTGVILPYARLINNSLFVFLEKFAIKKGLIIFADAAPIGSFDDGQSKSLADRVSKMVDAKTKQVYAKPAEEIAELCSDLLDRATTIIGTENDLTGLFYLPGILATSTTHFLVNTSDQELVVPLTAPEGNRFYEVVTHGEFRSLAEENQTELKVILQPLASVLLLLSSDKSVPTSGLSTIETIEADYRLRIKEEKWHFSAQSLNNIPLTRWNSRIGINRSRGNLLNYYETFFEAEQTIDDGYLIFMDKTPRSKEHLSEHFKVSLNGTILNPLRQRIPEKEQLASFFDNDATILIYAINEAVVKGSNRLLILSTSHDDLPNPIDFPPLISVPAPAEQTPKGWKILKTQEHGFSAWGTQGYPYMIGAGSYQHFFEVPEEFERIVLNFSEVSGSISITLNEKKLPTIATPPYRIDITPYLNDKRNNLQVAVNNTLTPITRLENSRSGIQGEVFLEVFE